MKHSNFYSFEDVLNWLYYSTLLDAKIIKPNLQISNLQSSMPLGLVLSASEKMMSEILEREVNLAVYGEKLDFKQFEFTFHKYELQNLWQYSHDKSLFMKFVLIKFVQEIFKERIKDNPNYYLIHKTYSDVINKFCDTEIINFFDELKNNSDKEEKLVTITPWEEINKFAEFDKRFFETTNANINNCDN